MPICFRETVVRDKWTFYLLRGEVYVEVDKLKDPLSYIYVIFKENGEEQEEEVYITDGNCSQVKRVLLIRSEERKCKLVK